MSENNARTWVSEQMMLFGAARMFVSFDERRFVSIEKIVVFPVLITVSYWFKIESGQSLFT